MQMPPSGYVQLDDNLEDEYMSVVVARCGQPGRPRQHYHYGGFDGGLGDGNRDGNRDEYRGRLADRAEER